jgi:thioesterase domain-containing protein
VDRPLYGLDQAVDGKTFLTRVEDLASAYIKELRIVQPAGPYFLGGHSFGGLVAFDMAQQLPRQGEQIPLLVLIDSIHPSTEIRSPGTKSSAAGSVWSWISSRIVLHLRKLIALRPREKARYALYLMKVALNLANYKIKQNFCQAYLASDRPLPAKLRGFYISETLVGPVYKASAEEYQPTIYRGNLVLIRSEVSAEAPESFWSRLVAGELTVYSVPGNHLSMLDEPNVQFLAHQLKACLEGAEALAEGSATSRLIPSGSELTTMG